jgi:hypothetical protein
MSLRMRGAFFGRRSAILPSGVAGLNNQVMQLCYLTEQTKSVAMMRRLVVMLVWCYLYQFTPSLVPSKVTLPRVDASTTLLPDLLACGVSSCQITRVSVLPSNLYAMPGQRGDSPFDSLAMV